MAVAQSDNAKADPRVHALLTRAIAAHGGNALSNLQTMTESAEMQGSGPFGMRMTQKVETLFDRGAASGRWQQLTDKGKPQAIYQQTPSGVFTWTEKSKTQKLRDTPSSFLPLTKTGIIGLLALQNTTDTLTYVEKGEIKSKKGPMIVRAQTAPQETLLLAGKGDFTRESCQTTWSYLFAPDGTLIAERVTQTQPKQVVDVQVSYDRFQIFGGIKVPTEMSVKNNQVPSMVTLKMQVKQVTVNAPIAKTEFQLP